MRGHLLRLDAKDRFMRFCNMLDDARISLFVEKLNWSRSRFIGCFINGVLRGVVQLSPTNDSYDEAEFAISVDRNFRGAGMALALMNHAITFAKADGISTLVMTSLSDNRAIKHLAGNLGFKLSPLQE
ncbi:MAG: GNAT family N-acetyltransferase, partial [Rhizobiales bacterium]|nr:GNAT family N-acetyltransferase [Hyphomicrobiales bacterium]